MSDENPEDPNLSNIESLRKRKQKRGGGGGGGGGGGDDERGRGVVRVSAGGSPWEVDQIEALLILKEHGLYSQGSRIVRPIWDRIVASGGRESYAMRLAGVGKDHLFEIFSRHVAFEKWDGRAEDFVKCNCPDTHCRMYLDRVGAWNLPFLLGVVTAPTLRADGSILQTPGYDDVSALIFDPRGIEFPPIPESPSKEDAAAALAVLCEPVSEFKFESAASRSVMLSGIITTVIRRALKAAPLHAFTASTAGAGKSILVDVAAMIATGSPAAVTSSGTDKYGDAEFEKRLSSSLLGGEAVISLDNMEEALGKNQLLQQMMTQAIVKIRPFGALANIEVPMSACVFATGNNLVVYGDMTRRTLVSTLAVEVERPELLKFAFDPLERAEADRARYVVAALTIVKAYLCSGEKVDEPPLGSFKDWSHMVREPLMWLGEADPVDVMESVRKSDPRLTQLKEMMVAWAEVFGNAPVTTRQAVEAAGERVNDERGERLRWPMLRDAMVAATRGSESQPISKDKMGWWLRRHTGRLVEGVSIKRIDNPDPQPPQWYLEGTLVRTPKVVEESEELPF